MRKRRSLQKCNPLAESLFILMPTLPLLRGVAEHSYTHILIYSHFVLWHADPLCGPPCVHNV